MLVVPTSFAVLNSKRPALPATLYELPCINMMRWKRLPGLI
jgi:hypothetical protein